MGDRSESEYRDVREALRYTSEALKDATKESQSLALALAETSTELKGVKKELDRARNDREDFARRLTTLESMGRGAEKTGANVVQYVSLLVAIGAAITGLVSILK